MASEAHLRYAPESAQGSGLSTGGGSTPDVPKLPIPSGATGALDCPRSGTFNGLGVAVNEDPTAVICRGEKPLPMPWPGKA
jgi:hypothetical protein